MTAETFSTTTQNKWPASRGLDTYNEMTGIDIAERLSKLPKYKRKVIDVGAGRGLMLQQLSERVKGLNAFAIGPNIPEIKEKTVKVVGGWAPSFELPISELVAVVVDVFGGFSYAMEKDKVTGELLPAAHKVLIREGSWLAPGGTARACSEVERLGDEFALERIQKFFSEAMGLQFSWEDYSKFAEGNGVVETQRRFILENPHTFKTLTEEAETCIGKALRGRIIWQSPDESAKIYEVHHHDAQYFEDNRKELDNEKFRLEPSVSSENPQWPKNRSKATYESMIGFSIDEFLKDGGFYFDSGSGSFKVPAEVAKNNPKVVASGISLTPPEELPQGITALIGSLPEFDFQGMKQCTLITDVFGAFTFADKKTDDGFVPAPIDVLIKLCLQLAPGGRLVICTEKDRLGDNFERERIGRFLKEKMGLDCKFEFYMHRAEARGIDELQLRITINNNKSYDVLVDKFEEIVGVPGKGKVLWESREERPEDRMQILSTVYNKRKITPKEIKKE